MIDSFQHINFLCIEMVQFDCFGHKFCHFFSNYAKHVAQVTICKFEWNDQIAKIVIEHDTWIDIESILLG